MGSRENWVSIGTILRGIRIPRPACKGVSDVPSASTKTNCAYPNHQSQPEDCKRDLVCFVDCAVCPIKNICNPMIGL
jgi:hypothetical protein